MPQLDPSSIPGIYYIPSFNRGDQGVIYPMDVCRLKYYLFSAYIQMDYCIYLVDVLYKKNICDENSNTKSIYNTRTNRQLIMTTI